MAQILPLRNLAPLFFQIGRYKWSKAENLKSERLDWVPDEIFRYATALIVFQIKISKEGFLASEEMITETMYRNGKSYLSKGRFHEQQ